MAAQKSAVRQSVSLPTGVAKRVQALAKRQRTSANRVIVGLIESGLQAREREKKEFFELADRLVRSSKPSEQAQIKEELARMTFGEYAVDAVTGILPPMNVDAEIQRMRGKPWKSEHGRRRAKRR